MITSIRVRIKRGGSFKFFLLESLRGRTLAQFLIDEVGNMATAEVVEDEKTTHITDSKTADALMNGATQTVAESRELLERCEEQYLDKETRKYMGMFASVFNVLEVRKIGEIIEDN